MLNAPEGYSLMTFYTSGSNVINIRLLICNTCGATVGNTYTHTKWHEENNAQIARSTERQDVSDVAGTPGEAEPSLPGD